MPHIVALGDVNLDIIGRFSHYPAKGSDAFAQSHEFHCGGSAANTAMALARMGLDVSLIARLGIDPWARTLRMGLAEAGVCCDLLQSDQYISSGLMYILVTPDGERTIAGHRGANALTNPDEIDEVAFSRAHHFHLSGYALLVEPQRIAALRCFSLARQHGLTISLDPGTTASEIVVSQVIALLPEVDLLVPTLEEAQEMTGLASASDCVRSMLSQGPRVVALKLGKAGCLAASHEETVEIPALDVRAQDTTGAGDSFAAGMIIGYLAGLDLYTTGVLANAMGAVTAGRVGGESSASMRLEVTALLRDRRSSQIRDQFADGIDRALAHLETSASRLTMEEGI